MTYKSIHGTKEMELIRTAEMLPDLLAKKPKNGGGLKYLLWFLCDCQYGPAELKRIADIMHAEDKKNEGRKYPKSRYDIIIPIGKLT